MSETQTNDTLDLRKLSTIPPNTPIKDIDEVDDQGTTNNGTNVSVDTIVMANIWLVGIL